MADVVLTGKIYLLIRERQHGAWSGHQLVVSAHNRRPTAGPGEYVQPLKLSVPRENFTQTGGWAHVTAPAPPPAGAEIAE